MTRKLVILTMVCIGMRVGAAGTATPSFQLKHLDTKGYQAKSIYRDANNIVWVGTTSGLLSLPQLMSRTNSLPDRGYPQLRARINSITGDEQGRLWLKTLDNDVLFYNPGNNDLVVNTEGLLKKLGIGVSKEFTVSCAADGNALLWKDNRLYRFNMSKKKRSEAKVVGTSAESIMNVLCSHGFYYVLTQYHIYKLSCRDGRITLKLKLPHGLEHGYYFFVDKDRNIWVRRTHRLACWREATREWKVMADSPSELSGIAQCDDGHVWISTRGSGIIVFDRQGKVAASLRHNPDNPYSLRSDHVELVSYDPVAKVMWVAYVKGGLSVYDGQRAPYALHSVRMVSKNATSGDVLCMTSSPLASRRWVGCEDEGIFVSDRGSDLWRQVVGEVTPITMTTDDKGRLWAGCYRGGLVSVDEQGSVSRYLEGESVLAICHGSGDDIYVALAGKGLKRINSRENGDVSVYDMGLSARFVMDLQIRSGMLYAATTDGCWCMKSDSAAPPHWSRLCEGCYRSIVVDSQNNVWLMGNDGHNGLSLVASHLETSLVPEELRHAAVSSVTEDDHGNIWVVANGMLHMLNMEDGNEMRHNTFSIGQNFRSIFLNPGASHFTDDGQLWIGTAEGYYSIDTKQMEENLSVRNKHWQIWISSISVNDVVLSPNEQLNGREVVFSDILFVRTLHLNYNENNLLIECVPPLYGDIVSDTYYYRVEGLTDKWVQMKDFYVQMSNMQPGNYKLFVRSQNVSPVCILQFSIAPPWWKSNMAMVLYVLGSLLLVFFVAKYVKRRRDFQLRLSQLALEREQTNRMNEMKLRFFTNISHDLRTPLTLICSPVDELRAVKMEDLKTEKDIQDFNSSMLQPSLEVIHRNAHELSTLVNQILDFRRIETGNETLKLVGGDIAALVADCYSAFILKARKEGISLGFHSSENSIDARFDDDKMRKIMMNLLSNAVKFTPRGGSVDVRVSSDGKTVRIEVADTGSGISDTDKPYVFDRFYQANSSNRQTIGSGIGLHITREYVKLHGGDITVNDNPQGQGTVFNVIFPLFPVQNYESRTEGDNAQDQNIGLRANGASLSSSPNLKKDKAFLLLVDDNSDLLEYMSRSLFSDYNVLTATNGHDALLILQNNDIDIIVSDVMMDNIDGLELCRRVKENIYTSHIPIVLLTAKSLSEDELCGLEAGADDYITKPFNMGVLRQRIQKLLERNQLNRSRFSSEISIEPSEITVTTVDEQFIQRAIGIVEQHMGDSEFSVEDLSTEMGVHRTLLYKKLIHLTGKTPIVFIRLLRLKRARQLLERSGMYVSEVAYQVGFNSPRVFSKYFKEEFGILPNDLKKNDVKP